MVHAHARADVRAYMPTLCDIDAWPRTSESQERKSVEMHASQPGAWSQAVNLDGMRIRKYYERRWDLWFYSGLLMHMSFNDRTSAHYSAMDDQIDV